MKRATRSKGGSVVFDKRRNAWNFLQYVDGGRRSTLIGRLQELPTKSAAKQALAVLRSEVQPNVSTLVEQYRVEKMPERYSTHRSYEAWLRNHIIPKWGKCALTEVQARPVELWLRSLKLAPRSQTGIRMMLSLLWDYAMWRRDVPTQSNPMKLVEIKNASKRRHKARSLTVEEFQKLLAKLREPFRTIALVCVCFGLRISEALALRWSDVDWLNFRLHVRRGIVRQRVDDTKTEYSERPLAIAAEMLEVLKLWRQTTQFSGDKDWMFASPVQLGRLPWAADTVNDAYLKAGRLAGIGRVSTHSMRHTYRSWLDAVGTGIAVQQKLMRHADIRTTMNVYGDVVTDEMVQAHSKVVGLALSGSQTDRKAS
jgi:integrase